MDIKVVYTKNFSEIKDIQSFERVYYNLMIQDSGNNEKIYGIELVSSKGDKIENQVLEGVSNSQILVRNIIQFLYENAVKPNEFVGVVSDIMSLKI